MQTLGQIKIELFFGTPGAKAKRFGPHEAGPFVILRADHESWLEPFVFGPHEKSTKDSKADFLGTLSHSTI